MARLRRLRARLVTGVLLTVLVPAGCKSVPTPVVTAPPVLAPIALDTKVGWILRLEQQRVLRDAEASPAAVASTAAPSLSPARTPDLIALLADLEPAVRRR